MDLDQEKELDQLLHAVIEMAAEQRAAFLDEACAGKADLRKQIEALLAAKSFIQAPTFTAVDVLLSTTPPSSLLHERKLIAGRYEIFSKLGKGGMGEVWHAYDTKLRVDVALKSLRSDLKQGPYFLEALRREVRSAREVISPNVCRLFDVIVEDEEELIVM
jgi:serine/threonine-protein kinase